MFNDKIVIHPYPTPNLILNVDQSACNISCGGCPIQTPGGLLDSINYPFYQNWNNNMEDTFKSQGRVFIGTLYIEIHECKLGTFFS